jgi:GTPase SAR1 family protein
MQSKRANTAWVIVGRKHTGKSTLINGIAKGYPKDKKVLIVDVNGSPAYNEHAWITAPMLPRWKNGIYRYYDSDQDLMMDNIIQTFRHGLIIFEDCTKYIKANPGQRVKSFLVDHRMWDADLIFTFHSFKRVPPLFWEMTDKVIIKKTSEQIDTPKNRNEIPNFEAVSEAWHQVMASKNDFIHKAVNTLI